MIRPLLVLGLAALFLQGCENLPWKFWEQEDKTSAKQPQAENVLAAEQPKSAPSLSEAPVPRPEPKPAPAKSQQQALAEVPEAEDLPVVRSLVGLDFTGVRDLLGEPALEEILAPATVWAYSGRGCVLNIFFYPHVDGGEFRALTYRAAGADQTEASAQQCFAELMNDQSKTETN